MRPKRGQKGTDSHSVVPVMPDSFDVIDPGSNLSGMGGQTDRWVIQIHHKSTQSIHHPNEPFPMRTTTSTTMTTALTTATFYLPHGRTRRRFPSKTWSEEVEQEVSTVASCTKAMISPRKQPTSGWILLSRHSLQPGRSPSQPSWYCTEGQSG